MPLFHEFTFVWRKVVGFNEHVLSCSAISSELGKFKMYLCVYLLERQRQDNSTPVAGLLSKSTPLAGDKGGIQECNQISRVGGSSPVL